MNNFLALEKAIAFLVEKSLNFAIFRQPNESKITLFLDLGKNRKTGFVLQPYSTKKTSMLISNDLVLENENISVENIQKQIAKEIFKKNQVSANLSIHFMSKNAYKLYVEDMASKCAAGEFKKAVATRIKNVNLPSDFNIGKYFVKLLENYSDVFVNMHYTAQYGLWIGATPELLLKKDGETFETVSLAGTKLISENRDWTAKEIEEQQIVTDYIKDTLLAQNCTLNESLKTETVQAGQIEHLKTKIVFKSEKNVLEILSKLHPTPAICGFPKEEAQSFIRRFEGNQRQLYTGFIGVLTEEKQCFYVNLRCMKIVENEALIYVGAGVTKDSVPAKEWQETEYKAITLLKFLA